MECLRIQKVNAFKQLVQTRSNAEKTNTCNVEMFIFCEAALQQFIMKSAIQINVN